MSKTNKVFYSHLVNLESIVKELDKTDLTREEKDELLSIANDSIHYAILDEILSELSARDKRVFLEHLGHDHHDKIWEHLNEKVDNVEEKIQKIAENFKKELHEDIREAKEKEKED